MMERFYRLECNCGEIIYIPADGEKHSTECPECHLTMFCDETGDFLRFVEQVKSYEDRH